MRTVGIPTDDKSSNITVKNLYKFSVTSCVTEKLRLIVQKMLQFSLGWIVCWLQLQLNYTFCFLHLRLLFLKIPGSWVLSVCAFYCLLLLSTSLLPSLNLSCPALTLFLLHFFWFCMLATGIGRVSFGAFLGRCVSENHLPPPRSSLCVCAVLLMPHHVPSLPAAFLLSVLKPYISLIDHHCLVTSGPAFSSHRGSNTLWFIQILHSVFSLPIKLLTQS